MPYRHLFSILEARRCNVKVLEDRGSSEDSSLMGEVFFSADSQEEKEVKVLRPHLRTPLHRIVAMKILTGDTDGRAQRGQEWLKALDSCNRVHCKPG